ncbi:MAG: glycosyltransferase family 2 protein, partial [Bacteroidetes bacterium]|nr:glycosyltransferase family 2 protein [Bacteroidota bacterium]
MSVYNGDKFLFEAIDSILHQTFTDFEFLIINDGSTDKTEEIILSFNDTRIVYHKNMSNEGLINCLNFGLLIAKGDYIARMDADDIAYPQRFEKQFLFMESNPEVGLLGSWVETIEEQQNRLIKFDS